MAITITQRANGASLAVITTAHRTPTSHGHSTTSRGWEKKKAARMKNKLMDVNTDALTHPHALTLTMTAAPSKPEQLTAIIKTLRRTLTEEHGMTGWAYVIEFTGARVPHLHALADFRTPPDAEAIQRAWLHALSTEDTTGTAANQHIKHAHDPSGWLNYMSKTAGKGYAYYRTPHIPTHWTHTGRLYDATLPSTPPQRHKLTAEQFRTVRDDMDAHNLRTTGKRPPRFNDARDQVTGRTAWGYHYTADEGKKSAVEHQQTRAKNATRPYILKEGATPQKRNRPTMFQVGRFTAETCQHEEHNDTPPISPPSPRLTVPALNTAHEIPRLFLDTLQIGNTNMERIAQIERVRQRMNTVGGSGDAPRMLIPRAPYKLNPLISTRAPPRSPPRDLRSCLRGRLCRYSSRHLSRRARGDPRRPAQGDEP